MMSCPTRGNGADASGAGLHQGDVDLHYAHTIDMDVTTLYACLWLRSVVFNGEQQCTEPDLDGRELEPTMIIVWASVDGRPVGTLRVLDDKDHLVIGRVAVDAAYRGLHIGRRMMISPSRLQLPTAGRLPCTPSHTSRTGTAIVDSSLPVRIVRRLGSITSRWLCVAKAA